VSYPAGIGMMDIPGFRNSDVAAQLSEEAWEESISPHNIALKLLEYMEYDLPMSQHFKAETLDAFERICQRMTGNGHLAELAKLGAYFGCNAGEPE